MRRPHPRSLVLFLLLLTALGGRLSFLHHNFGAPHGPDPAAESDERLRELKEELRGHSVVGYTGPDEHAGYYRVQYSLAPVIVVYGAGPELVIGDRTPAAGREPVKDFGGGLTLYRK